jgi:hypothetical protein
VSWGYRRGRGKEPLFSGGSIYHRRDKGQNPIIDVMVWCHCWTVAMDDDGKMIVDVDPSLYYSGLDRASRARVDERIRKVDAVIGRVVGRGTR